MKFTLSWLKDHLDTNATLDQISETLTAIGLEVEEVIQHGDALKPFIVAEILEATQHPNADKLRVCKVNDGTSVRQVVCGAPNARAGIKVVLATEGVKIPANGMVIKKSAIRSVESNGMLCSAAELGLGADGGGIIELPASAKVGESIVGAMGLDDPVIDIAITPNRADCLGVYGIARDLAAAGLGTLKPLAKHDLKSSSKSSLSASTETPACPLFVGCTIKCVKNGPSPEWLQRRLEAIGLRPISALVDITNYMTYTYGRPLHVFDAAKLKGNINVRSAKDGEKFKALGDKEYTLSSGMIAVCDDSGVVALGGVIGGAATGCDESTTDVFLEAAYFDPISIATAGRILMIESDARYRFERGVDPAFVKTGAEIAVAMILELCGGSASELVIAGTEPTWQRHITFDTKKVESLGGLALPKEQIIKTLTQLGCTVKDNDVMPPSWRADIEGSADLVEEILRIARYDSIASAPLPAPTVKATLLPSVERASVIRKSLAMHGMTEICNFAFVSEAEAKQFGSSNEALKLLNPISTDLAVMRPSLLPGLISAAARNAARGFTDLALFEIGNVFEDITQQGQKQVASGIRTAQTHARTVHKNEREVDAFDAKADLFSTLKAAGMNASKLAVDRNVPAWYHPSRSGRISLGGKVTLGYFGEIHPLVLATFGIKHRLVAFEAFLDNVPLPKQKAKAKPTLTVSNFQAVTRDFAFVGEAKIQAADIIKTIESTDKQLVRSVNIFDVYAGKGVAEGQKSVAIAVTLQAMDRTLTDAEIDAIAQKIIAAVLGLGLTLRA